jgi:hypothetical protein
MTNHDLVLHRCHVCAARLPSHGDLQRHQQELHARRGLGLIGALRHASSRALSRHGAARIHAHI